jgi:HlyD family secretion protein
MQVKTAVHESVLDQVYAGQRATIRVDAFPDLQYAGTVQQVAVLPDQGGWMSSDTKVYPTIVTIDEEVEHLKPGMTAVVEIHVEYLKGVTTVPIQAVLQRGKANWCFIGQGRDVQLREIALGRTNDRFVEIVSGINEGDRVVLNPMSLADALPNQDEESDMDLELDDLADPDSEELVATSAAS